MSCLKNINTFEVRNDMVAGFSGDNFLFNLWKTWLKVIFHKGFCLLLVLFTFCHDHFKNFFLVVDQSELPELGSHGFTSLNVWTHDIVAVGNVLEKIWSCHFIQQRNLHQLRKELYVVWDLTFDPTPTLEFLCLCIQIEVSRLKQ